MHCSRGWPHPDSALLPQNGISSVQLCLVGDNLSSAPDALRTGTESACAAPMAKSSSPEGTYIHFTCVLGMSSLYYSSILVTYSSRNLTFWLLKNPNLEKI